MVILVTGATGFLGKRVCNMLLQKNHKIRVISRNSSIKFDDLVIADLAKDSIEETIFSDVTSVIHLAGHAHDLKKNRNTENYFKLNVDGTKKLAEMASISGVKNFIFISSTKAGVAEDSISSVGQAEGIYGQSKRAAELAILNLSPASNMKVNIIRPALIYGPEVKGNLRLMLNGIKQGWFPPLPSIGNKRSMVHVDDVASCISHIMEKDNSDKQIYQLTDGNEYSSSEIYDILCKVSGKNIHSIRVPLIFFRLLSRLHPSIRYKINKLLGDETFSNLKIISTGFKPKKTLQHINETDY
ncbi:NAD-dependent epimerase/dehydratase family protein [SAR86 cluster bacterium]|nr:NAD-dependent epimerase/dehydratase family protein [SAR86 cluster bacterium]